MADRKGNTPSARSDSTGSALAETLRASLDSLPERPTIARSAAFTALDSIEHALNDMEGSAVDQLTVHGENLDYAEKGPAPRLAAGDG
jgi:hypothetical protein